MKRSQEGSSSGENVNDDDKLLEMINEPPSINAYKLKKDISNANLVQS